MLEFATELWPLNRSLSGPGTLDTLRRIQATLPELVIDSFRSGDKVFDWEVPREWEVDEAYIITPSGEKICDFSQNNLHLVGYSTPVETELSLTDLQQYLHSLPSQPEAIPYVTSYYKEQWGFCISQSERQLLQEGTYKAVIRSRLFEGSLHYGELYLPGKTSREIFFSTYVCHPSMANNELSGPVLATFLAKFLKTKSLHHSVRFLFIPETIGSLAYMTRHLERMKREMVAGYVLTCVGDDREISFLPSRSGQEVSDKVAKAVLERSGLDYKQFAWSSRGSDERQYCSPGADLPVSSIMRSKYGEYPEYHTSLDTLGSVVTERGLQESFEIYQAVVKEIESTRFPVAVNVGEPQMGRRGLYPQTSIKGDYSEARGWLDILSLSDGRASVEELAHELGIDLSTVQEQVEALVRLGLIRF